MCGVTNSFWRTALKNFWSAARPTGTGFAVSGRAGIPRKLVMTIGRRGADESRPAPIIQGQPGNAPPWEYERVKLLDKFEQSIERLMEGTAGTLFNQSVQPAEIGKKLERAMLSQQRASMGTSIVPNIYEVGLHPKDFAQVAGYRDGLARQMEAWLAQEATRQNLSVLDRIRVSIDEDPKAKRRNPVITAEIADRHSQPAPERSRKVAPPAQPTSVYRVETQPAHRTASLRALDGPERGRAFIVPPGVTSVGRAPDNDIVLDSPNVSRRHARVECGESGIRVVDQNSTNGTWLNGEAVRVADVTNGDEITFGGVRMAIEIHSTNAPGGRAR